MKLDKDYYSKEYFVGGARGNYVNYSNHPTNKALINLILRNCKKQGVLLEIACAYGFFLKEAENYFETYGVDISEYAIDKARKITNKTKLINGNIIDIIPNLKEKFDIIVALDVLEHLPDPKNIIETCYNLLKEDSYFIFRIPNKSSLYLRYLTMFNDKSIWSGFKDKSHISLYPLDKWKYLLTSQGFKFKMYPSIPTIFLKKMIIKINPRFYFLPQRFHVLNDSIVFICKK